MPAIQIPICELHARTGHFVRLAATKGENNALSASVFLRASEALHLICAKEHGFREIYSNDTHLLQAAKHFGIKGRNVIK